MYVYERATAETTKKLRMIAGTTVLGTASEFCDRDRAGDEMRNTEKGRTRTLIFMFLISRKLRK
jgi:hypothetical protein